MVDQNPEIEGRTRDASGRLIIEGTPIARVESERYELAVATAAASVARAEQDLVIAQTDLDETIPAQIDAAEASVELARVEYDRSKRLSAQNAGSQRNKKRLQDSNLVSLRACVRVLRWPTPGHQSGMSLRLDI